MKSKLNHHYMLLAILLVVLLSYSNSEMSIGSYPYAKRLDNGNYIIISSTGIYFSDRTLTTIKKSYPLTNAYSELTETYSTKVEQFSSDDGGYIVVIRISTIFIFSNNGEKLYEETDSTIFDAEKDYSIVPYKRSENNYYFWILYPNDKVFNSATKINYKRYIFNSQSKTLTKETGSTGSTFDADMKKGSFACKLMKETSQEQIVCIYGKGNLNLQRFNVDTFTSIGSVKTHTIVSDSSGDNGGLIFKLEVLPNDKNTAILCFSFKNDNTAGNTNSKMKCGPYYINTNSFGTFHDVNTDLCPISVIDYYLEYFYETEETLVGCKSSDNFLHAFKFNKNLEYSPLGEINLYTICNDIKRMSIVFPSNQDSYIYLNDCGMQETGDSIPAVKVNDFPAVKYPLNCTGHYYDYEQIECIDEVPEGYFVNDTEINTIDKCHTYCKTCNKAPTNINTNCLLCSTSIGLNLYYDEGNCIENCVNGFFLDEKNNNIPTCKCSTNIACHLCLSGNKCQSCNTANQYYPIYGKEKNSDNSINCYNGDSIDENYYLDKTNTLNIVYKECYPSCASCIGEGNDNNQKCTSCKSGFFYSINNNNIKNCYPNCEHYYYFNNSNIFICTSEDKCPSGYKLINGQRKCIKDCTRDTEFNSKVEYNKKCYTECPTDTKVSSDNKCVLDCALNNKYFNFEKTECINTVPEGYYCNNEDLRTIDKCHSNCKTCNTGGTLDENNCLICKDDLFYDLGNCRNSCPKGDFIDENNIKTCKCSTNGKCKLCTKTGICKSCNLDLHFYPMENDPSNTATNINCYNYENIPENYYLVSDDEIYKKCYQTCALCSGIGNANNNLCTKCTSDHFFAINNAGVKNCYPKCDNYYYFDDDDNFNCEEECPIDYKLIDGQYKCIKYCTNDIEFNSKYEYQNRCYKNCPTYYYTRAPEGSFQCELDCKYYNKYSDITGAILKCITIDNINPIPEGYYISDETNKYIDKCYSTCKTCSEGGTVDNHNCLTCKDDFYYDLGNCVELSSCSKGGYKDSFGVKKCYCSVNNKCEKCSLESNRIDLCESCNNDNNYYPKENDAYNTGKFINCYNTAPQYHLLDTINKIYRRCYETCATCSDFGNEEDHQCLTCISNHQKTETGTNCNPSCGDNKYYYIDENNNYQCVDECPGEYKLIYGTKKCILDCENDDEFNFKFEYDNICYETCPGYTRVTEGSNKCSLNCKYYDKYFNYEKTDCLDNVPDEYYCDDEDKNTIAKCHENCAMCFVAPTEKNTNCFKCKFGLYNEYGNCKDNCVNGFINYFDLITCKCSEDIRCGTCDEKAISLGLCDYCNSDEGYYQKEDFDPVDEGYLDCFKDPEGYYLDEYNYMYLKCFETCKFCTELGDRLNHKCTECISTHEFKNDFDNNNCYEKCTNYYYYDPNNNLVCTTEKICPEYYPKFVINKNRCIEDCKMDNINKYEYKNQCYETPPPNTKPSLNDNYYLVDIEEQPENPDKCNLISENLNNVGNDQLTNEILNNLAYDFADKYGFFNKSVQKLENQYYKIFFYTNKECLKEVSSDAPVVDLDVCSNKIKEEFEIESNLINVIIIIKDLLNPIYKHNTTYAFANPNNGQLLDIKDICKDEKIEQKEDIINLIQELVKDEKQKENLIYLTKQGINVFDSNHDFYHDLCYQYDSPNNKDIPMRERAALYYTNVTLCEAGCNQVGFDMEEKKVKCSCSFKNFMDKEYLNNNKFGESINEILDIISSLNIEVIKCISKVFKAKYFKKCIGGFISLAFLVIECICMGLFLYNGFKLIEKHCYYLKEAFYEYRKKHNDIDNQSVFYPPKKEIIYSNKNLIPNESKKTLNEIKTGKHSPLKSQPKNKIKNKKNKKAKIKDYSEEEEEKEDKKNKKSKKENKYIKKIREYINPKLDENDFDDIVKKDKRTFGQYFCERFIDTQRFINTFYNDDLLKPRTLKIVMLCFTIEIYFIITALFYTEDYLCERFISDKKENFFSFIPNRINEFIYISCINGLIAYLMKYIFDNDELLKRIFKKKEHITEELKSFMNHIKCKFISLLVITLTITVFGFIYLSCFNAVYPYIRVEYVKSSIFIIIVMELINLISTLLETCFRFLAIKCKSIRLFKLSELLD